MTQKPELKQCPVCGRQVGTYMKQGAELLCNHNDPNTKSKCPGSHQPPTGNDAVSDDTKEDPPTDDQVSNDQVLNDQIPSDQVSNDKVSNDPPAVSDDTIDQPAKDPAADQAKTATEKPDKPNKTKKIKRCRKCGRTPDKHYTSSALRACPEPDWVEVDAEPTDKILQCARCGVMQNEHFGEKVRTCKAPIFVDPDQLKHVKFDRPQHDFGKPQTVTLELALIDGDRIPGTLRNAIKQQRLTPTARMNLARLQHALKISETKYKGRIIKSIPDTLNYLLEKLGAKSETS